MRPHRLRVTAFGPFPGTEDVDLDEVSAAGPFLLRGATGAGKTSLLDAVGYALFGKVPGARGLKQLRSDHAPDHVRTSVELWATVSGRAVHVVRTPDQRRPRSRGPGWTTDRATVSLRVARDLEALEDDRCELRLAGVQEANDELARLVGMTHEQFVQVVLLPQGDFARFLRAKDDERAGVLRALFDTSRFGAVEEHLRVRRDRTRDALATARTGLTTAAARVAALVGQDEPPTDDLPGWAGSLLADRRCAVDEARAGAEAAADQVDAARLAHTGAGTRTRLLRDLVAVAQLQDRLLARSGPVAAQVEELEAADRAVDVVARHETHQAALRRVEALLPEASAAAGELPASFGDAPDAGPGHRTDELADAVDRAAERLDEQVHRAVADHAGAEALRRSVERRRVLTGEVAATGSGEAEARDEATAVRLRLDALPGRVQEAVVEQERLSALSAGAEAAALEVDRWQDVLGRARSTRRLLVEVGQAEVDDLAARSAARAAEARLDELRRARLAGMSAELATTLRPGEPCGVCGATEHPAPARPGDLPVVDADDEEHARQVAADRGREAGTAAAALATLRARLEATRSELAGRAAPEAVVAEVGSLTQDGLDRLVADVEARVGLAVARTAEAGEAARAAAACGDRLDALREEQRVAAAALAEAEKRAEGLAATLQAGRAELARLDDELEAALGATDDGRDVAEVWSERTRALAEDLRRLRGAAAAVSDLRAGLTELARTGRETVEAAAAAGWPDVATAVAAARTRAWREQTRRAVTDHDKALHAAADRLARLTAELAEAGVPGPAGDEHALTDLLRAGEQDEADALGRLREAERFGREADDRLSRHREVLTGLERTVPDLLRTEAATGPLRREAEAARALADLCSGANDKGIPLSTYVLAAHLEHVVQAANQRLHGMSDGRYALVHVEEGEDRRRRAGLGLAVLDAWTGVQRPAGTLSGGETFLASLSLALGLADVVTAEAGGVRIDALFVDEGFGTLDPDSLDRAMDVLDQLQEHGRMVGVVSHVGELQQRLPRQVHVEGGRAGSTVQVLTG